MTQFSYTPELPLPLPQLQVYQLTVTSNASYTIEPKLSGDAVKVCGKIYMLTDQRGDATIHYVGQTSGSMTQRLNKGMKDKNGYRWATQAGKYQLLVWALDRQSYKGYDLESIEAELVFAVRVAQKAWPKWQRGIHFRHVIDRSGWQPAPRLAIHILSQYYDEQIAHAKSTTTAQSLRTEQEEAINIISSRIFQGS